MLTSTAAEVSNVENMSKPVDEEMFTMSKLIGVNSDPPLDYDDKPVGHTDFIPPSESYVIPMDTPDARRNPVRTSPNTYAAKKTVAQGMMDIALITANANQLRYIVEYQSTTKTFYLNISLICISLLLQIAVGISLIFKGRFDLRGESKSAHARRINNYVVVGVFLVTIINVFVASFTINSPTSQPVIVGGVGVGS